MKKLPCIDCVTFPICQNQIDLPPHSFFKLMGKCCLLKNYLAKDGFYNYVHVKNACEYFGIELKTEFPYRIFNL